MKYKTIVLMTSLIIPVWVSAEESTVPRTSDMDKIDMEETANLVQINDTKSNFVNYCIYIGREPRSNGELYGYGYDSESDAQIAQAFGRPRKNVNRGVTKFDLEHESLNYTLRLPKLSECPKAIKIEHSGSKGWQISDKLTSLLQVGRP